MWPFKKKFEAFGIEKDEEGNLTFNLTEEEAQEVENVSKMFDGYAFNPDYNDELQKVIIARGLSNCANSQITLSNMSYNSENRKNFIERAFASTMKAYSYHQLPIYLYDGACLMAMMSNTAEAEDLFRKFLKRQSKFKPNQIDELNLKDRDIDEAIRDAEKHIKI